jgi:hypothetical protein
MLRVLVIFPSRRLLLLLLLLGVMTLPPRVLRLRVLVEKRRWVLRKRKMLLNLGDVLLLIIIIIVDAAIQTVCLRRVGRLETIVPMFRPGRGSEMVNLLQKLGNVIHLGAIPEA